MTNRKTAILISIFVVLPMIIGGMIYLLSRPTSIVMFSWLDNIGLETFTMNIRSMINAKDFMNNWIIYNFPALLWSFSFTCFLGIIWNYNINLENIFILIIPMCLGIVTEVFQKTGVINGTFDKIDSMLYIIGGLLGFLIIKIINHKTKISVA